MYPYDDHSSTKLRRQAEADERDLDELTQILGDEFNQELNQICADWVDNRGRPLPGFEPVEAHAGWEAKRRQIERQEIERRRALRRR